MVVVPPTVELMVRVVDFSLNFWAGLARAVHLIFSEPVNVPPGDGSLPSTLAAL